MSVYDALVSLAKSQRRIAGEYAAEIKAGLHSKSVGQKRTEIARLRRSARDHLQWARRERDHVWNQPHLEAAE